MILADEIKDLEQRSGALERCLNIEQKRIDLLNEEEKTQVPDFWDKPDQAREQLRRVAAIKAWVDELGFGAEDGTEHEQAVRQIQVRFDGGTVVYELNDCAAADALLAQLPLTIDVEDYSTNEKIFYPPQALDTTDAPLAEGGAGVLAYYAPWGDVVMFYDGFGTNGSLYALGQAVSGEAWIGQMSGTVTVEMAE